ncbi:MAG: nucleotidyltransferase family protein [Chloroflexota bacterium]|nr:nucleotidyltransferase family protein [Chloroflexota bacterium]
MKAIVLAGGRGQRLQPLTLDRPKCLVEVAGKSIAQRQLEWLAGEGVDEVIFSCGYRWEMIRQAIGDNAFGMLVRYAPEEQPLGRGGGLRHALSQLQLGADPVVALNGDVLTRLQLADMAAQHQAAAALATLLLVPYVSQHGIVDLGEDDRVVGFREKPRLPYWLSGGVYLLSPAIRELLPERGDHETTTWPELARQGRLHGYRFEGFWRSLDSAKDVAEAEAALSSR